MKKFFILFCLLVSLAVQVGAQAEQDITLSTVGPGPDNYPKFYYETDVSGERRIAGLAIDIMRTLETLDPHLHINLGPILIPWRRVQVMLETGDVDCFFGLVKNEKRLKLYQFLPVPLYDLTHVTVVRRDNPFHVESFDDFPKLGKEGIVANIVGSGTVNYIKRQNPNVIVDDVAIDTEHGLRLVAAKRYNFFYYHDLGIHSVLKTSPYRSELKVLPVAFRRYSQYAACSPKVSPLAIERLTKALQRARDEGILQQIFSKYTEVLE